MRYDDVAIPLSGAWASPFVKWQGSLSEASSLDVAANVTSKALAERAIDPGEFAGIVLGWTVPQPEIFYGAPTLAARIGAEGVSGPMISQACATSVACLHSAAGAVTAGGGTQLVVAADRVSNGPQLLYPSPGAQGGAPQVTNWVLDSFARDPWAGAGMLAAAEVVAAELGATRSEVDDLAVLRSEQYSRALADDRAFQRRYLVPVEIPRKRRDPLLIDADEGIRPLVAGEIAALRPVTPDGVHTFATQTHPADGCAGAVVTDVARARSLSGGKGVARVLATGFARVGKSHMPEAPVPAAAAALDAAGMTIDQVDAVTTHNPFAVNDLYFAKQTGFPVERMNAFGCSLIFGHPQGPTGLRSITELIEELRLRGGGVGLFTGCAAGDTGAAVVVRVED
ncbi:thiolase family protein [Amycolatopsis thermoflava]|uniref:Probable acetyl-CoA acetyltransferase n=1 Tax=Amycolatopsis thermoflava TaxID=84480 RepID=A0A3N2G8D0_9PSEU|nr:thiolase family protein [Amycolatopsis thermoflava]ROS32135.1 acetyl-CoA C-acetyltransferase [Amycolatopsis thermoflava]